MKKTHFALFACNQIGADVLKILAERPDCVVDRVFTYDLPLDVCYGFDSVNEIAEKYQVPVVKDRSTEGILKHLQSSTPDYIISAYYRKILTPEILKCAKKDSFNIHPSRLPYFRGPTPTAWAILAGEKEIGITIHKIDAGIDTGDILAQKTLAIDPEYTGFMLHKLAMKEGAKLFEDILPALLSGDYLLTPQEGNGSYYGPVAKLGSQLLWHESVDFLERKVRCFAPPYGGMFGAILNKKIVVFKAIKEKVNEPLQGPGRIARIWNDGRITVSCADGYLSLVEYEFIPKISDLERSVYFCIGNKFD